MFAKKRNKTQYQMRDSEVMLQKEVDTPWSIYRDFTAYFLIYDILLKL